MDRQRHLVNKNEMCIPGYMVAMNVAVVLVHVRTKHDSNFMPSCVVLC